MKALRAQAASSIVRGAETKRRVLIVQNHFDLTSDTHLFTMSYQKPKFEKNLLEPSLFKDS